MIAQLQHSLWLANTILSAGRITRADIDRRWAYSSLNDNHESFINERTFHRWRQGAESLLGILIECDRHAGYVYYIPHTEDIRKDQSRRWLLDSFAMAGLVRDEDMQPYVLLEEMPSDAQYLTPIMDALRNRRVLSVRYQRFDAPEGRTFTMQTYCVKSFKRRWYMIGLSSNHPDEVRIYALDRILSLQILDQAYTIPQDFDGRAYFKNYYGIFRGNVEPTRILIEVNEREAKYLRSLPLHSSQREIPYSSTPLPQAKGRYSSRFEYFLAPTLDFIQELRTFGADLKVIEPLSLVNQFKQLGEAYQKLYH